MTYSPNHPSAALCALALALSSWSPVAAQETGDLDRLRERALALVNEARGGEGMAELAPGENLDEAALAHAEDMARRDYYAHVSPEGETVAERFIDAGGDQWELVAENIARCTGCPVPPDVARVEELHEGWMNSPGHRANILGEGLSRFGFGIMTDGEGALYAVQTFAGPGVPRGGGEQGAGEPIEGSEAVRLALAEVNTARRKAGAPEMEASDTLTTAARALVPADLEGFALDALGDAFAALPENDRARWASIASVAGACGGCGTEPTRGDPQSFASDWLAEGSYRDTLLDPQATLMGFVLRTDGAGRKVALALLGQER